MTMAGSWCLDDLRDERGHLPRDSIFLDCKLASKRKQIPYAGFPTTVPAFSGSLDVLCLLIFSIVKYDRYRSRRKEKYTMYRDLCFAILVTVCVIDIAASLILFEK